MAERLNRIVTRSGDCGDTGLADGSRLAKDHPRVQALGEVDELNAHVGLLLVHGLGDDDRQMLTDVQQRLFDIGASLAMPGHPGPEGAALERLERRLKVLNGALPPLEEFILPGGANGGAQCHVARTVCRRCERSLVGLDRQQALSTGVLAYLNRLSDYLFVLARSLVRQDEPLDELQWEGGPGEDGW